jgi:hypothetical protein
MRIGRLLLLLVLLLAGATVVVTGARECDMEARGMTVRVRATGEDITENAGDYARNCLARVFRSDEARDDGEPFRPRSTRRI